MARDRKQAIAILSETLLGIDPTGFNLKFYSNNHFKLPDKQFDAWMTKLKNKEESLIIYAPSESGVVLDYDRNLKYAEKKGIPIIERLWFEGEGAIPSYLTPVEYTVLPLITRRQAQRWFKKASIPSDMKKLNPLTGQPTGESQAAKMSLPESQLLAGSGLEKSLIEVLGPRGGDSGAGAALTGMLVKTGKASLQALRAFSTGVDATKYMKSIFIAAHIRINP